MADQTTATRGVRKRRQGRVATKSGDKSIVVLVERRVQHPLYRKTIKKVKKFHVHDEKNVARIGDHVSIVETRPVSRLKRWRLLEVLSTSGAEKGAAAE
ncbi:MAG: 30S ribosomal protein S17 [Kiritimatiellia bacterium]|jgi:small subunit ribosomal protein S17|nr:30S ribosomal protein S17 [Kiritimatiellia bacterium]MDP6848801.1 30S ribosomal protein S17 [Kiritimatiellia bacterium]